MEARGSRFLVPTRNARPNGESEVLVSVESVDVCRLREIAEC